MSIRHCNTPNCTNKAIGGRAQCEPCRAEAMLQERDDTITALREENAKQQKDINHMIMRYEDMRVRAESLRDVLESAPAPEALDCRVVSVWDESLDDDDDVIETHHDNYESWFHGPRKEALK